MIGDIYLSIDVEADGPIPMVNSMTSVGICVAGTFDGAAYQRRDPSADTFYRELQPISQEWIPEALAVGGFTRGYLAEEGVDPAVAIPEAVAWIEHVSGGMPDDAMGQADLFSNLFLWDPPST